MRSSTRTGLSRNGLIRIGLCVVIAAAAVPAATATAAATESGSASVTAEQSKKKKDRKGRKGKKSQATTATVQATWTVSRTAELNGGTETETITVTIPEAKATFAGSSATGTAKVQVDYQARFLTEDRSWQPGCDTEQRISTATWTKRPLGFRVYPTSRRTTGGREQSLVNGWAVELDRPTMNLVTTGFYQEYETLAQLACRQIPLSEPLTWWGPDFVHSLSATGKLNGDGKGVLLTAPYTGADQTGTVKGTIGFSKSVAGGTKQGRRGPSLN